MTCENTRYIGEKVIENEASDFLPHHINLVVIFRAMLPQCTNINYYVSVIQDKEWWEDSRETWCMIENVKNNGSRIKKDITKRGSQTSICMHTVFKCWKNLHRGGVLNLHFLILVKQFKMERFCRRWVMFWDLVVNCNKLITWDWWSTPDRWYAGSRSMMGF